MGQSPAFQAQKMARWGSFEAFLDGEAPIFPSSRFLIDAVQLHTQHFGPPGVPTDQAVLLAAAMLGSLAPAGVVATLKLLAISLRRAGIRRFHLWRVAVCSCDAFFWLGLYLSVRLTIALWRIALNGSAWRMLRGSLVTELKLGIAVVLIIVSLRLASATGRYLQLAHGWAIGAAAGAILADFNAI